MLNAMERAEKIMWIMAPHPERLYYTPSEKKADIAAQITEAEREAVEKAKEYWNKFEKWCDDPDCDLTKELLSNGIQKVRIYEAKKFREGFNAAKEQAARVVEDFERGSNLFKKIADKIRAMTNKIVF